MPLRSVIGTGSISFFVGVFGILMRFDLITKEKESETLKTLLSQPVFRDEIITGKAIGGFTALVVIVTITFSLLIGIVIMAGFVPSIEDLMAVAKFAGITLAHFFTFSPLVSGRVHININL